MYETEIMVKHNQVKMTLTQKEEKKKTSFRMERLTLGKKCKEWVKKD